MNLSGVTERGRDSELGEDPGWLNPLLPFGQVTSLLTTQSLPKWTTWCFSCYFYNLKTFIKSILNNPRLIIWNISLPTVLFLSTRQSQSHWLLRRSYLNNLTFLSVSSARKNSGLFSRTSSAIIKVPRFLMWISLCLGYQETLHSVTVYISLLFLLVFYF